MIFALQYTLTLTPVTETRYREETRTIYFYDELGTLYSYTYNVQVPYEYYILNVYLVNHTIENAVVFRLTAEQYEMYLVYMETKGNKPELFT